VPNDAVLQVDTAAMCRSTVPRLAPREWFASEARARVDDRLRVLAADVKALQRYRLKMMRRQQRDKEAMLHKQQMRVHQKKLTEALQQYRLQQNPLAERKRPADPAKQRRKHAGKRPTDAAAKKWKNAVHEELLSRMQTHMDKKGLRVMPESGKYTWRTESNAYELDVAECTDVTLADLSRITARTLFTFAEHEARRAQWRRVRLEVTNELFNSGGERFVYHARVDGETDWVVKQTSPLVVPAGEGLEYIRKLTEHTVECTVLFVVLRRLMADVLGREPRFDVLRNRVVTIQYDEPKEVLYVLERLQRAEKWEKVVPDLNPSMMSQDEKKCHAYDDNVADVHAFAHFALHHTDGKVLPTDVQGVLASDGRFTLSDCTLTSGSDDGHNGLRYSVVSHGDGGLNRFRELHACNSVCQRLGLAPLNARPKRPF